MVREHTNVLCEKDLKEMATARGISMSQTLEEGLRAKLLLPEEKEKVSEKLAELRTQVKYLESAEFREVQEAEIREQKAAQAEQKNDIAILRRSLAKSLQTQNKHVYNRLLHAYCEKYKVEMVQAVALAESKPKEGAP